MLGKKQRLRLRAYSGNAGNIRLLRGDFPVLTSGPLERDELLFFLVKSNLCGSLPPGILRSQSTLPATPRPHLMRDPNPRHPVPTPPLLNPMCFDPLLPHLSIPTSATHPHGSLSIWSCYGPEIFRTTARRRKILRSCSGPETPHPHYPAPPPPHPTLPLTFSAMGDVFMYSLMMAGV